MMEKIKLYFIVKSFSGSLSTISFSYVFELLATTGKVGGVTALKRQALSFYMPSVHSSCRLQYNPMLLGPKLWGFKKRILHIGTKS